MPPNQTHPSAKASERLRPLPAARTLPEADPFPSAVQVRRRLLGWYARNRRTMPWRGHPQPYAVWVSEIMLQQTRVDAVIPYFERFTARFPSVEALAAADLQDVLRAWQGLGYYARARNLHRAARCLCERHGAALPRTLAELRALPGVGRYTAAAIASICFGIREPVIDGNVLRVAARVLRMDDLIRTASALRRVEAWLGPLIGGCRAPGEFNQALMELGALVCTPRDPRCMACPWARFCRACAADAAQAYPVKTAPRKLPTRRAAGVVLWKGRRLLLVRRAGERFLGDLWELPGGFLEPGESAASALMRIVPHQTGLTPGPLEPRGQVRQEYSHFRLELEVFEACVAAGKRLRGASDRLCWTSASGIERLPLSNAPKAALAAAATGGRRMRTAAAADPERSRPGIPGPVRSSAAVPHRG